MPMMLMQRRTLGAHIILASALAAALLAWPVLAQTTEGAETSYFKMFFTSETAIGWIIIWLLIVMSVCVMALIIQGVMNHRATVLMPPETITTYEALLAEKRYSEAIERAATDPTTFGQILHAALSEASNGYGAMTRAIEEQADLLGSKRTRALTPLDVMGAIGPMIGLFGTVYGMIVAFQELVRLGGQPRPADLAAGISTALVTTLWGLVVGIPAIAAATLLRAKIDGLMVEAMVRAEELIGRFKPTRRSGSGSAVAAGAPKSAAAAPRPRPAASTQS